MKLEPNKMRAFQAICYLLSQAHERGLPATQYVVVKSLFLADRMHLNRFGRPITFDNYVAMEHGPVPGWAYNVLKGTVDLSVIGIKKSPWSRHPAPNISKNAFEYRLSASGVVQSSDLDELSESDIEALSEALTVVSSLSFKQLKKLTHEDAAYEDAWEIDGAKKSYPMSYGLLFDVPDYERAEDLAFASKQA